MNSDYLGTMLISIITRITLTLQMHVSEYFSDEMRSQEESSEQVISSLVPYHSDNSASSFDQSFRNPISHNTVALKENPSEPQGLTDQIAPEDTTETNSLRDFWWVPPQDFSFSTTSMTFRGGSISPSDLLWTTFNTTKVFKPLNLDNTHLYNLVPQSQIYQPKDPKEIRQSLFDQLRPAVCSSRLPSDKNSALKKIRKDFH